MMKLTEVAVYLDCAICSLTLLYPVAKVFHPGSRRRRTDIGFRPLPVCAAAGLVPPLPVPCALCRPPSSQRTVGHSVGNAEVIIVVFSCSCPGH